MKQSSETAFETAIEDVLLNDKEPSKPGANLHKNSTIDKSGDRFYKQRCNRHCMQSR